MTNHEEKFFLNLKGKMNSEERKDFEDELNNSESLKKDFTEYKKLTSYINEVKDVHLNGEYSETIITEFRERLESKRDLNSFKIIRYSFSAIVLIVVGYFLISFLDKEKPVEITSILTEFSDDEIESLSYNFDYSADIENHITDDNVNRIDSIYNEKLSSSISASLQENGLEYIFNINNLSDVDEYLSENDVDIIYAQLINKEFL